MDLFIGRLHKYTFWRVAVHNDAQAEQTQSEWVSVKSLTSHSTQ